jgi:hypothetical protein
MTVTGQQSTYQAWEVVVAHLEVHSRETEQNNKNSYNSWQPNRDSNCATLEYVYKPRTSTSY